MEKKVSEDLQVFIKKERWEYKFPLTGNIRLYEDLGIYGDDAVDFFIAFGKAFNVDVSNFLAGNYFKGEGGIDFVTPIVNLFKKNKIEHVKTNQILTLEHLEKAIKAGRLDEEVINS